MVEVKSYLEKLESDTTEILDFVKKELVNLNKDQLFYKNSPHEWSILECLKHINLANRHYVETMEQKIEQAITNGSQPVSHYVNGWIGKKSIKAMTPTPKKEIKSKMKTLKRFRPQLQHKSDKDTVFEEFFDLTDRLKSQIQQAKLVNVNEVRIVSALGPLLKFKLGDALGFVIGHTQRHILQIKNQSIAKQPFIKQQDR